MRESFFVKLHATKRVCINATNGNNITKQYINNFFMFVSRDAYNMNQTIIIGIVIAAIIIVAGLLYWFTLPASADTIVPPSSSPTTVTNPTTGASVTVPPSSTATAVSIPHDTTQPAVAVPVTTTASAALTAASTAANSSSTASTGSAAATTSAPVDTTQTASASVITQTRSPFFTYADTDWYGYDTTNQHTADANACGALCQSTQGCNLFTYGADGTCFMKQVVKSNGVFSIRRPDGTYMQIPGSDLPGFDISHSGKGSVDLCNADCTANGTCMATMFDTPTGTCYLKKPKAYAGATSGWIETSK